MKRSSALAMVMLVSLISCARDREDNQSALGAGGKPGVTTSVAPGTTKIDVDPKTGRMVTTHLDSSGKWHTVDMEAVLREIWKIPPGVKAEEFDFDSAPQPSEPSADEMNRIMQKHYLD